MTCLPESPLAVLIGFILQGASIHACECIKVSSVMSNSATLWTVAQQALLSVGLRFSKQEYWSGLPLPSPGDLPNAGIEPVSQMSPALEAGTLPLAPPGKPISRP